MAFESLECRQLLAALLTPAMVREAQGMDAALLRQLVSPGPQTAFYDYVEDGVLKGGRMPQSLIDAAMSAHDASPPPLGPPSPFTTIEDNGPASNRIDLVLVGDGYTSADLSTYYTHADALLAPFFAMAPLDEYASFFNIHRVDVISNESGVDNDPSQGISRDTALDAAFWGSGIERLLVVNVGKAQAEADSAPDVDQVLVLANSTKYGGAGYSFNNLGTVSGGNASAVEVAKHEFGHSFADLADEYDYADGTTYSGGEPTEPNISIQTSGPMAASQTKWHHWLDEPNVDAFEGAKYKQFGVYRPTNDSLMRSLGQPLDQINIEQFVVSTYKTVKPIDDATAAGSYSGNDSFFATPVVPVSHTLDVQWFLDGDPIPAATSSTFDASSLNLSPGSYTLEVVVVDNTLMVRDPALRTQWLSETREWTLEVTASLASLTLDAAAAYTEGTPVLLSPNAALNAPGFSNFAGGSLTLSNPSGSASDRLVIQHQGDGLDQIGVTGDVVSYSGTQIGTFSGGVGTDPLVIELDADATVAATQALLRAIAFDNVSNAPTTTDRTVTFVLDDGVGGLTDPQSVTVSLTAANDAPLLNTGVAVNLGSIAEDSVAGGIAGTQVSTLLAGVSDPDGTPLQGVAVISLTEKLRGTWQYSLDAGASWLPLGSPDEATARLLFPANRVRFVPNTNYHGTPKLSFRAWDRSNGLAAGDVDDTAGQTGGEGPYSTASKAAPLSVTAVNDAPVLNTGVAVTLGTIAEDTPAASNPGKLVSDLLAGVSDADAGALKGIAVVALTEKTKGTWQYSLDGGASWLSLGAPSETAARHLLPTNRVRFRPGLNYFGAPQLGFRAWDRSNALAAGGVASTVGQTGGVAAYSAASKYAKVTVTPVNDKPVLTLSGSLGYVRNSPPVILAAAATLTDPDSADFATGELRVRIATGGGNNNTLAIGSGFTVDGANNVFQGATLIGTRTSSGIGTSELKVKFNASATKAVVQALVRSITYSNVGGSVGPRTIEFTVSDGDTGLSDVRTKTVNVT